MTYEYLCTSCENAWEAEQSISEPALTTCPHCGQQTAKRQVSGGAGFILKGGGWYADLYGSAPKKPAEASSETPSSGDAKKTGDPKTGDAKKGEASSGEGGSAKKEISKGSGGSDGGSNGSSGSDGGSKGPSGAGPKGGADSSAA